MGQHNGSEAKSAAAAQKASPEQLSKNLAVACLKSLTSLEAYCLKDVFTSLADTEDGMMYWTEDTFIKFLEIPDSTGAGSLLFKSASYLAAFPYPNMAPAPLSLEGLAKVIAIYTGRSTAIKGDLSKTIFSSFAVIDRGQIFDRDEEKKHAGVTLLHEDSDDENEDDDDDDDDDDLQALEALDELGAFSFADAQTATTDADKKDKGPVPRIPTADMRNILIYILGTSAITTSTSIGVEVFGKDQMRRLGDIADAMVAGMRPNSVGIDWAGFKAWMERSGKGVWKPLSGVFDKFLYSKKVASGVTLEASDKPLPGPKPGGPGGGRLPKLEEATELMTPASLAQMGMFIPTESMSSGVLHKLYVGSSDGFSSGMYENKVLKYPGSTVLLVSGEDAKGEVLTFGCFLGMGPWRVTMKDNFGDRNTILFQLGPVHETFPTTPSSMTHYAYFARTDGVGFGRPPPSKKLLGSVSLTLSPGFETATFRHFHDHTSTFSPSTHRADGETVFDITEVEVWGLGTAKDQEEQRKAWEWEVKEAERRQNVNVKDFAQERALLEMAGLVGGNRSGGSSDNENGLDVDEDLTSPGFMSSSLPALPTHSHARPDPDPCPDMIAIIDHSDPSFSDPTGAGEPFAQHVTLTDPQIVGGKYVAYLCTVTTPQGTEIQCRKRYSEFRALEGMLKVSYPVIVRSLPRFPGKSVVQKFRAEFVDRRRRRLEFWLSCVLLHPNLGGSTVVRKWWTEQVE
ncbi:Restriction of telomere capping protein 5 [Saitoella coloradoensis]